MLENVMTLTENIYSLLVPLENEFTLLKWVTPTPKDSVVTSKIKVQEPNEFHGTQSTNELENFLQDMVQYFKVASQILKERIGMLEDFVAVLVSDDAVSLAAQTEEIRQNLAEIRQVFENFVVKTSKKFTSMLSDVMILTEKVSSLLGVQEDEIILLKWATPTSRDSVVTSKIKGWSQKHLTVSRVLRILRIFFMTWCSISRLHMFFKKFKCTLQALLRYAKLYDCRKMRLQEDQKLT